MGGHELGGDGGGGAAHQSKEEYSDAEPELHERPPIFQLTRCLLLALTMNDFRTARCGFSHEARRRRGAAHEASSRPIRKGSRHSRESGNPVGHDETPK